MYFLKNSSPNFERLLIRTLLQGEAPVGVQKYLNRSANWQNICAQNLTSLNFTGFLAPRFADGAFNLTGYNPALCGCCEWDAISYEATPFGNSVIT